LVSEIKYNNVGEWIFQEVLHFAIHQVQKKGGWYPCSENKQNHHGAEHQQNFDIDLTQAKIYRLLYT
jgi:hypothetical protein